jgi:hypothetical protein
MQTRTRKGVSDKELRMSREAVLQQVFDQYCDIFAYGEAISGIGSVVQGISSRCYRNVPCKVEFLDKSQRDTKFGEASMGSIIVRFIIPFDQPCAEKWTIVYEGRLWTVIDAVDRGVPSVHGHATGTQFCKRILCSMNTGMASTDTLPTQTSGTVVSSGGW